MKKTISFEKKIDFPTMIGEITAISLEHNLKFIDESNIEGEFEVSGNYKLTEASRIEEPFNYKIPADIVLGEKLDLDTTKIEIEDFYYEIENDDRLICYIDVKVEGVEEIEITEEEEIGDIEEVQLTHLETTPIPILSTEEVRETLPKMEETIKQELETPEVRECDGDNTYEEEISEEVEEVEEQVMQVEAKQQTIEKEQTVGSLFSSLKDSDETFATYSVYILRQEESVQSILEKYKITKEELESYNDLSNLGIGTKIIIPFHDES